MISQPMSGRLIISNHITGKIMLAILMSLMLCAAGCGDPLSPEDRRATTENQNFSDASATLDWVQNWVMTGPVLVPEEEENDVIRNFVLEGHSCRSQQLICQDAQSRTVPCVEDGESGLLEYTKTLFTCVSNSGRQKIAMFVDYETQTPEIGKLSLNGSELQQWFFSNQRLQKIEALESEFAYPTSNPAESVTYKTQDSALLLDISEGANELHFYPSVLATHLTPAPDRKVAPGIAIKLSFESLFTRYRNSNMLRSWYISSEEDAEENGIEVSAKQEEVGKPLFGPRVAGAVLADPENARATIDHYSMVRVDRPEQVAVDFHYTEADTPTANFGGSYRLIDRYRFIGSHDHRWIPEHFSSSVRTVLEAGVVTNYVWQRSNPIQSEAPFPGDANYCVRWNEQLAKTTAVFQTIQNHRGEEGFGWLDKRGTAYTFGIDLELHRNLNCPTGEGLPDARADANQDSKIDVADLDAVMFAMQEGLDDPLYDLDGDGYVNQSDLAQLMHWMNTQPGDANLDGVFNSADLVLVGRAGEYEDSVTGNSTWATGDWNGDGEYTSADLVVGFSAGYQQ